MVSAEIRALRAQVQKLWKSIEAAGPSRLRPPVTDYDLETGGIGEQDPEAESLFDTTLDQFWPPDSLFESLRVHDGEYPGAGTPVVDGFRLLSFAEMCQCCSPRTFPPSKHIKRVLPIKYGSLNMPWPIAVGERGRAILVETDGVIYETRDGKPSRIADSYLAWLECLAKPAAKAAAKAAKPAARTQAAATAKPTTKAKRSAAKAKRGTRA